MTWVDGNIGSRLTVSHPEVWLVGPRASGEVLTVAYAGDGQNQNTGATIVHAASDTTSAVVSKAIAKDGGRSRCRGVVRVEEGADGCTGRVQSDALVLDDRSISEAYPQIEIGNADAQITQETSAQKLSDDQRFYLMTRGLSREQATGMIVNGFIEPVTRTLPMEYAVEWNRLIELHVEGSIG
jgi:Fe-S cluster assembly protein SufB